MTLQLDSWCDYACPACFIAFIRLEKIASQGGLQIRWRSFQLRPPGVPAMPQHIRALTARNYAKMADEALVEDNIALQPGPVGIDTRLANIALQYANTKDKGEAFNTAVMKAYWLKSQRIDFEEVLRNIGKSVGLDLDEMGSFWHDTPFAALVDEDRALASTFGIHIIPATLVARKYLVSGQQPVHVLQDVIDKAVQETATAPRPVALAS